MNVTLHQKSPGARPDGEIQHSGEVVRTSPTTVHVVSQTIDRWGTKGGAEVTLGPNRGYCERCVGDCLHVRLGALAEVMGL